MMWKNSKKVTININHIRGKNVMKKSFSKKVVALLLTLAVCITSVVGNQASVSAKSKIKISNTKITLTVGKSKTLKVKGTKKKAKWSSSKKSVATVTSKGKVTAKKSGKTTITAKIGKKKYICKVTVKSAKKTNNANNVNPSTPTKPVTPKPSQAEIINSNYSKLKNIIQTYGNTNDSGNKYITHYDSKNNIQYGIVYENNGMFDFIMIDNMDHEIKSSCSMYVNTTVSDNVNPELIVLFQKNGVTTGACTLETSFLASQYGKETILYFTMKKNVTGLTEADFQKYANSNLKLAFSGWQLLLMEKADMQFTDLGFFSYK